MDSGANDVTLLQTLREILGPIGAGGGTAILVLYFWFRDLESRISRNPNGLSQEEREYLNRALMLLDQIDKRLIELTARAGRR